MGSSSRLNVILFAGGCFNPPTFMHLRMFEVARDFLVKREGYNVLGGVVSPTHDSYKKESLKEANSDHRNAMISLALENNDLVKLSTFETNQSQWTRTRIVLEEHKRMLLSQSLNEPRHSWVPKDFNPQEPFQILLLCGGDLLQSFDVPGLWMHEDIQSIVRDFGLVVISREGSDPESFIYKSDLLTRYRKNIHLVTERIHNDISSTKIRRAIRRRDSVRYLISDQVIRYISDHDLYTEKETELNKFQATDKVVSNPCMLYSSDDLSSSKPKKTSGTDLLHKSDSDNEISDASSFTSSVQSQLSQVKSSSPGVDEIRDEAVEVSPDDVGEPNFSYRDFDGVCLSVENTGLPLIDEKEEDNVEDEETASNNILVKDSINTSKEKASFQDGEHKYMDFPAPPELNTNNDEKNEAFFLEEKTAVIEDTTLFLEETVESTIDEIQLVVETARVEEEEIMANMDSIQITVLPLVEDNIEREGEPVSSVEEKNESTDNTEEKDDSTVINVSEQFLETLRPSNLKSADTEVVLKDDSSELPEDIGTDEEMNQYVVILTDKSEDLVSLESDPPPPPQVNQSEKKTTKKNEDKVQIEITKKGIIVICDKESFL